MPEWFFSFPEKIFINIRDPIDQAIQYILVHWDSFFKGLTKFLRWLLKTIGNGISWIPWWGIIVLVFLATWKTTKKLSRAALYSVLIFVIGTLGLWELMIQTLTIIITAVIISLLLGLPLGVLSASNKRIDKVVRPVLDMMQTMPSFVYLIPAVMLMGLGSVPAVIATTIYSLPPVIRLTSLGLQQVDTEVMEAAKSFGSTRFQTLFKVQIPQAMPTIMTGVNQTMMMAIAMVVTCSMIAAPGLGDEVIKGINRLESGRGFAAGIAIVILAIVMDRLTQGIYEDDEKSIAAE